MKTLSSLLFLLLLCFGGVDCAVTVSSVVVQRAVLGVKPISMVITFSTSAITNGQILRVDVDKIVFGTIPVTTANAAGNAVFINGGGATAVTTDSVVLTTLGSSQFFTITLGTGGTITGGSVTIVSNAAGTTFAPSPAGPVTVSVSVTDAAGTPTQPAVSNSYTVDSVGTISALSNLVVTPLSATTTLTALTLSFTPSSQVLVPNAVNTVAVLAASTITQLVITASGAPGLFKAGGATTPITGLANCKVSATGSSVVDSTTSSTLTLNIFPDTGDCKMDAGVAQTITLATTYTQKNPAADTTVSFNARFQDGSGGVFVSSAATPLSYISAGVINVNSILVTRLVVAAFPVSMSIGFTPTASIASSDLVQIACKTTAAGFAATAAFSTAGGLPPFTSGGCTWTLVTSVGTQVTFSVSRCTVPANQAVTLTLPSAYLAVNPAAASYTFEIMSTTVAGVTRNDVVAAATNSPVFYTTIVAPAMTVSSVVYARDIELANPLSMTLTFQPKAQILPGDTFQLSSSGILFASSASPIVPITAAGGCVYTPVAFAATNKNVQFNVSGCTLAPNVDASLTVPGQYLNQVANAATVVAESFDGARTTVNVNAVSAVVTPTSSTNAGTLVVGTTTMSPSLFAGSQGTGLSITFTPTLQLGVTDRLTFTSVFVAPVTTAPSVFQASATQVNFGWGNCLYTLASGASATSITFILSNNGTLVCNFAKATAINVVIPQSYLAVNPAAGTNVRIAVGVAGTGLSTLIPAPTPSASLVLGYFVIAASTVSTDPNAIVNANITNRSAWVNAISAGFVQQDIPSQGRIAWTVCKAIGNTALNPVGHPWDIKAKGCGAGVSHVRTFCFIQAFDLSSLGYSISTLYPPSFACNVDRLDINGTIISTSSLVTLTATFTSPVRTVILYRPNTASSGVDAASLGGSIILTTTGNTYASDISSQTSTVTGSTVGTFSPSPDASASTSGKDDDAALALGLGIGLGLGIPVALLLLALCYYVLFYHPQQQAAVSNDVYFAADEKPYGNPYYDNAYGNPYANPPFYGPPPAPLYV